MASPENKIKGITPSLVLHKGVSWIRLDFTYDEQIVSMIKSIRGRRWSQTYQRWFVPDTMDLREKFGVPWTEVADNGHPITSEESGRRALNQSLLKRVKDLIQLKGYSPQTDKSYLNHLKKYLDVTSKMMDPTLMVKDDIETYLLKRQNQHPSSEK